MSNTTNLFEVDLVRHLLARYQPLLAQYDPQERVFGVEWSRLAPNELQLRGAKGLRPPTDRPVVFPNRQTSQRVRPHALRDGHDQSCRENRLYADLPLTFGPRIPVGKTASGVKRPCVVAAPITTQSARRPESGRPAQPLISTACEGKCFNARISPAPGTGPAGANDLRQSPSNSSWPQDIIVDQEPGAHQRGGRNAIIQLVERRIVRNHRDPLEGKKKIFSEPALDCQTRPDADETFSPKNRAEKEEKSTARKGE